MKRKLNELHPHPINKEVYDAFDPKSEQGSVLVESIRTNGLLERIIACEDGTILSGHRRWEACLYLGIEEVEVDSPPDGVDDRIVLIEANRARIKTVSERMREAQIIEQVEREKALARKSVGRGNVIADADKGETRNKVAEAIGMKGRTYDKAKQIYEAAKENPNAAAVLAKVDAGTLSIDAGHKAIRVLITDEEEPSDRPDFIRTYNAWNFSENDPRFGQPHPGRIPGQIAANVIYYYTEPGDLVVDPMAGGGSTLDAAAFLGRRAIGYDVRSLRPDISQHDISSGFPDECEGAQLIFMDPPYWNMIDEKYSDGSSSRMSLEKFKEWYQKLILDACRTVNIGGFVAIVNMGQYFRLPDDFQDGYIDWPFVTYQYLSNRLMRPWARMTSQISSSVYTAFDVASAVKNRHILPVIMDIVIARRVR